MMLKSILFFGLLSMVDTIHARAPKSSMYHSEGGSSAHHAQNVVHASGSVSSETPLEMHHGDYHYKVEEDDGAEKKSNKQSSHKDKQDTSRKDLKKSIQRIHYEGEDEEMTTLKEQDPKPPKRNPNDKATLLHEETDSPTTTDFLLHHIDQHATPDNKLI